MTAIPHHITPEHAAPVEVPAAKPEHGRRTVAFWTVVSLVVAGLWGYGIHWTEPPARPSDMGARVR